MCATFPFYICQYNTIFIFFCHTGLLNLILKLDSFRIFPSSFCARTVACARNGLSRIRTVITEASRGPFPSQNGHGERIAVRRCGGRQQWGNSQATTPFFLLRKSCAFPSLHEVVPTSFFAPLLPPARWKNESESGACFVFEAEVSTVSDYNLKEAKCQSTRVKSILFSYLLSCISFIPPL